MTTRFLPDSIAYEEMQLALARETARADAADLVRAELEGSIATLRQEGAGLRAWVDRALAIEKALTCELSHALERVSELEATVGPIEPRVRELSHATAWRVDKASVCTGNGTRVIGICNKAGRPDASMAFELVGIHNRQVLQLLDEAAAIGPLRDEMADLQVRLEQVEDTRTAAQAEATRQTNGRREFEREIRKALRIGPTNDAVGVIYRLQRLADAARSVVQHEVRS